MAATPPETTNAADVQRDIFRFFDLPRELRDMVYEYALHDGEPTRLCDTDISLQPRNIAHRNVKTVCRQLKSEMGKVADSRATLHVFDLNGEIPRRNGITSLPIAAATTSALVVHLLRTDVLSNEDDEDMAEMQEHRRWINKLLQMLLRLCSLTVLVHTYQEQTCCSGAIGVLKGNLAPFLELAHLEKVEVYKAEGTLELHSIEEHDTATNKSSLLVMKWSAVGGE